MQAILLRTVSFCFAACIPYTFFEEVDLADLEPLQDNTTNTTLKHSTNVTKEDGNASSVSAIVSVSYAANLQTALDPYDTHQVDESKPYATAHKYSSNYRDETSLVSRHHERLKRSSDVEDVNVQEQNLTKSNSCVTLPELGRFVPAGRAFQVQFSLRIGSMLFPNRLPVTDTAPMVLRLVIKQNIDTGGTLKFGMNLMMPSVVSSLVLFVQKLCSQTAVLNACSSLEKVCP